MNNKEFISELSNRLGYTSKDAAKLTSCFIAVLSDAFQEGDSVAIQSFGTFEIKKKLERVVVNPVSKQRMLVPPKLALSFKPSPSLKEKFK